MKIGLLKTILNILYIHVELIFNFDPDYVELG